MPNELRGETRPATISVRSNNGVPMLDETYHFLVEAETKYTSRLSVLQTTGLPIVGVTVSSFGLSVCRSKTATRRPEQPTLWDVTCEFSSEVAENQTQSSSGDPINADPTTWVPIYETKFERLNEVVTRDYSDAAIANSAGQPFEVGLTIGRFIPVWEFFQIESATVTDETIIARNESVNDATFKGRAAKSLLLSVVSSTVGYYYGAKRRLTQYSLKYNPRLWTHKRLDVGTVFLDGGVLKPYTDNSGNVILGGLNGSGAKVSAGSPPAVRSFDMYPSISFSAFLRT